MSRIHEAMRRAEQERVSDIPPRTRVSGNGQAAGNGHFTVAHENLYEKLAPPSAPSSDGCFNFDEVQEQCTKQSWTLDPKWSVFSHLNHQAAGAEQFRTLRSRVYRLREKRKLETLLVTSATAAEGKTYVASNFAQALARQQGRRVLLVDADLRNPQLHVRLGAPTSPGLSDYLQGKATEMSIVQHGSKDGLYFIPAGARVSNPSELVSSDRLKVLFSRLTPAFDWTVIDVPPVLPVSDASTLAELCDGVLLVVRAGHTPLAAAQKACTEFRDRNLVGLVLNHAEEGAAYAANSYQP